MSAAKKYYWLKLKTDFFNQREIKKLRKIAGGDTFTIIYLKMQLLSVKNEGVITFEQTENHLDEQLALELDEELENVRLTLLFLQNNALIEPISDFDYMMPKVVESIGSETDSAERVRKLRKREKQLALQCNDYVTTCNTEIELKLENKESKEESSKELKKSELINEAVAFHNSLENLPKYRKLTEARKSSIHARIVDYGIEEVKSALLKANNSNFLNKHEKWYDFDWVYNPNNFAKIIEGKFDNKENNKKSDGTTKPSVVIQEVYYNPFGGGDN